VVQQKLKISVAVHGTRLYRKRYNLLTVIHHGKKQRQAKITSHRNTWIIQRCHATFDNWKS